MAESNVKAQRRPGRAKGCKKSGGRQKGARNKDRAATAERIMKMADPIGFLCDVCRGVRMEAAAEDGAKKRTWWYPTADQRIGAAVTLSRKVLPDLRATELTGKDGGAVAVSLLDFLKGLPA